MQIESFKMRTFNCGANHEIVLPNGKVLLVDPYFINCKFDNFTRDDVTGADYIILTHGHFDHDSDLGYLAQKFNAKVFCGTMSADHVVRFHKIPYDNIFPVFPGSTYTMEGITFHFWQAKHNESGMRTWDPDRDIAKNKFGVEGHKELDHWGSMESIDWMLTTENGFRIMMCSGRAIFAEAFDRAKEFRPNVLLRQAGVRHPEKSGEQVPAREMAELLVKYGSQLIFPFHMDVLDKKKGHEWTVSYMQEVAQWVKNLNPGAAFVYPEALKWYSVGIGVTEK